MDSKARGMAIGLVAVTAFCAVVLHLAGHPPFDFIERHFGVSPDGGDGSMELLLLVVAALIVAALAWRAKSGHALRE